VKDATHISILDTRPPKRVRALHLKVLAAVLAVMLGAPMMLYAWIIVVALEADSKQVVAGETILTTDWIEITPESPLRLSKQYQLLILDGVEPVAKSVWQERAARPGLGDPDLEVVLISERGEAVPVRLSRAALAVPHQSQFTGCPPDGVYLKLRVRSDKPARLRKIVWHCWRNVK
jgi:hypothetical protein